MARTAEWPWYQAYTGPDDYRMRELLRAVLDLHGYFGDQDEWVWRGQASAKYCLSPAVHTRITTARLALDDAAVVNTTNRLLCEARTARIDTHEGVALPDLALLSVLQHHGAATPLLDVSLDPLVALYMAVVSPTAEHSRHDGVLFALKRPRDESPDLAIRPFDNRSFESVYDSLPRDKAVFYTAPDVSERLRIQRGHFLLARHSTESRRVTIPLTVETCRVSDTWLAKRMDQRGKSGKPVPATTDIATFRVPWKFKPRLQQWLEERTGLTSGFVYPTPWHQPHLEMWAKSQSRVSRL